MNTISPWYKATQPWGDDHIYMDCPELLEEADGKIDNIVVGDGALPIEERRYHFSFIEDEASFGCCTLCLVRFRVVQHS